MRIIVFSDVHNNYFAIKALYEYLLNCNSPNIKVFFLGDLIGYLKYDHRIIQTFEDMKKKWSVNMILGNHDGFLLNRVGVTNLKINESEALEDTIKYNLNYWSELEGLLKEMNRTVIKLNISNIVWIMSHAGISDIFNHYYYPDRKFIDLYPQFFKEGFQYVCGHTHRPFIYIYSNNTFINVGSVGLPRDGDPRLSFLEISEGIPVIKRMFYDLDSAYEYNSELPKKIKNSIYFGGRSKYYNVDLLDIYGEYCESAFNIKQVNAFKNAIYFWKGSYLHQVYKVVINRDIFYLYRIGNNERLFNSLSELMESIIYENL